MTTYFKNYKVYELDDGFVGGYKDICSYLNVNPKTVYSAVKWGYKIKNRAIKVAAVNGKEYGLFENGALVMKGTHRDIAQYTGTAESTVRNAKCTKRKLLGKYEIKEIVNEKLYEIN